MKHILRVWLYGGLSSDHLQPLSKVILCLHSYCDGKTANPALVEYNITGFRNPKVEQGDRKQLLIAKGTTDTKGKIELHLSDRYPGGAFDVGIQARSQDQEETHYVYLTTLTPSWYEHGNGFISAWNYCLLPRLSN